MQANAMLPDLCLSDQHMVLRIDFEFVVATSLEIDML